MSEAYKVVSFVIMWWAVYDTFVRARIGHAPNPALKHGESMMFLLVPFFTRWLFGVGSDGLPVSLQILYLGLIFLFTVASFVFLFMIRKGNTECLLVLSLALTYSLSVDFVVTYIALISISLLWVAYFLKDGVGEKRE